MKLFRAKKVAVILSWLIFATAISSRAQQMPGEPDALSKMAPAHLEILPTFWELHGVYITTVSTGIVLLLVLLLWLLLRPKPPVILSPGTIARNALTKRQPQPETGACLSEISQVLRRYFIAAFKLSAGELTTSEFTVAITDHEMIGAELAGQLSVFLRQCDEYKFTATPSATPLSAASRALEFVALAESRRTRAATAMESSR